MGATTFVDKVTVINTDWLNDVNGVVWTLFGGTTSPSAARTALGLGTIATQNANSVAISGGAITGGTIGGITSLGVNTPSGGTVPLTVAGASGNGQIRALHSTGSGLLINQSSAAGAINILQQDNDAINFGTNNATSLVLQSNGDVLVNRATSGTRAFVVQNTDAASGAAATSYLQTDAGLLQMTIGSTAGGGTASILSSTTGATNIYTTTATSLQLGTNNRPDDIIVTPAGVVLTGGTTSAPTNYTTRGDVALPAARGVRANNTAKAWVRFDGTPVGSYPIALTATDSFGVSSITKNAVGDYTITFAAGIFADANYCAVGTAGSTSIAGFYTFRGPVQSTPTATEYRCRVSDAAPNYLDVNHISIAFFGD